LIVASEALDSFPGYGARHTGKERKETRLQFRGFLTRSQSVRSFWIAPKPSDSCSPSLFDQDRIAETCLFCRRVGRKVGAGIVSLRYIRARGARICGRPPPNSRDAHYSFCLISTQDCPNRRSGRPPKTPCGLLLGPMPANAAVIEHAALHRFPKYLQLFTGLMLSILNFLSPKATLYCENYLISG